MTVLKVWDPTELELAKGLLESNGIPVFVKREALGELYAMTLDGLGRIELMVPQDRCEEASGLLRAEPEY